MFISSQSKLCIWLKNFFDKGCSVLCPIKVNVIQSQDYRVIWSQKVHFFTINYMIKVVQFHVKGYVIKSQYFIVILPQKVHFVTRLSWKSLLSLLINTVLKVMVFNNFITAIASVLLCRLVFLTGNIVSA